MTYATQEEVGLAMNLNYNMTQTVRVGSRFQLGDRHRWAGREGWQTAEVIDNIFTNHKVFSNLTEALRRKL